MGIGGSKKSLKEQMRENKRMINKSIRELDRERTKLQNQEKKLVVWKRMPPATGCVRPGFVLESTFVWIR